MRVTLVAWFVLTVCLLIGNRGMAQSTTRATTRPADPRQAVPVMKAARIDADFAVDGDVGKPVWQRAAPVRVELTIKEAAARPELSTTVRCLWSGEFLYLSYHCPFTRLTTFTPPNPRNRERPTLWARDVVEVFLGPDLGDVRRYAELEIAPTNEQLDLMWNLPDDDLGWSARAESVAKIDQAAKVWTVEVRIPLKALTPNAPKVGTRWRLNLYRADWAADVFLAWRPTLTDTAHAPDHFGILEFAE